MEKIGNGNRAESRNSRKKSMVTFPNIFPPDSHIYHPKVTSLRSGKQAKKIQHLDLDFCQTPISHIFDLCSKAQLAQKSCLQLNGNCQPARKAKNEIKRVFLPWSTRSPRKTWIRVLSPLSPLCCSTLKKEEEISLIALLICNFIFRIARSRARWKGRTEQGINGQ